MTRPTALWGRAHDHRVGHRVQQTPAADSSASSSSPLPVASMPKIDQQKILEHIKVLSSDEYQGRAPRNQRRRTQCQVHPGSVQAAEPQTGKSGRHLHPEGPACRHHRRGAEAAHPDQGRHQAVAQVLALPARLPDLLLPCQSCSMVCWLPSCSRAKPLRLLLLPIQPRAACCWAFRSSLSWALDHGCDGKPRGCCASSCEQPCICIPWQWRRGGVGMLATSLNLLPGGQLDGGHIIFAVNPRLHRPVSMLSILVLLLLSWYFWAGWLLWAVVLRFTGSRHPDVPLVAAARCQAPRAGIFCAGYAGANAYPCSVW